MVYYDLVGDKIIGDEQRSVTLGHRTDKNETYQEW